MNKYEAIIGLSLATALVLDACGPAQATATDKLSTGDGGGQATETVELSTPTTTSIPTPQPPESTPTYAVLEGTKNNSEFATLFSGNTELVAFNTEHPVHKTETGWVFDDVKDFLLTRDGRGIVTMNPTLENQTYDHSASIAQVKVNAEGQTELWIGMEKYNLSKGEWEYNIVSETKGNAKENVPHILTEDVTNDNWGRAWEAIFRLLMDPDQTFFAKSDINMNWEIRTTELTFSAPDFNQDGKAGYSKYTLLNSLQDENDNKSIIPMASPGVGFVWIEDQSLIGLPITANFGGKNTHFLTLVSSEGKLDPMVVFPLNRFFSLADKNPAFLNLQTLIVPVISYTNDSDNDMFDAPVPLILKESDPSTARRMAIAQQIINGTVNPSLVRIELWGALVGFNDLQ